MRRILLFVLGLWLLQPAAAWGLNCVATSEPDLAHYDAVVVARVLQVTDQATTHNQLLIEIEASYKGIQERQVELQEHSTWGSMSGPSEVGEDYLFFLKETDGIWENPLCSQTMKLDQAAEWLANMKGKELPLPETDEEVQPAEGTPSNDEERDVTAEGEPEQGEKQAAEEHEDLQFADALSQVVDGEEPFVRKTASSHTEVGEKPWIAEYLLMIGGAILVFALVFGIMVARRYRKR